VDVNITRGDGEAKVVVTGRLDTVTAPQLQEELLPEFENGGLVVLDFTELVYVSSAGLRVLLQAEKTAQAKGAVMKITGVCPEVLEVFEMTGFTGMLNIV